MAGIVVAGTHSGCGKTTVTLGLLAALRKRGLSVQPFKTGPDFIDTGLQTSITGRSSRNLDLWMCGKEYVQECFRKHSSAADIAVVEGVMGLFDGDAGTAALAAALGLPVVLVIDAYGMAETAGALVHGFVRFSAERNVRVAGVVFNRVASENHYKRLCAGTRDAAVLGYLSRDGGFEIPHRHLGLMIAEENPVTEENFERLADAIEKHIDLDGILGIAGASSEGFTMSPRGAQASGTDRTLAPKRSSRPERVVAIAYDKAFSFYYEDNLDLLRERGAEIVRFSPLRDSAIPADADAVYLGGGYPELHARALSENAPMLASFRQWSSQGKPLYAECGGMMYLSRGIHDFEGGFFPMAGIFPFETKMKKGRAKLGYRRITLGEDCILGAKGDILRGHEFHYSELLDLSAAPSGIYTVANGSGDPLPAEGYRTGNILASYIHVHFGSNSRIAEHFILSTGPKER